MTWRLAAATAVPTLLLGLAGLTLGCLAALEILTPRAPEEAAARPAAPAPSEAWRLIRANRYLAAMALLVMAGAMTETLLDYVLSAAVISRVDRGAPLMSFFALYHTVLGILALGLQATATRHSLERLGLGGTLSVQPALVAIGSALAAVAPGPWPRVALRAAQAIVRNSLFRSAYELLYMPLPPTQKRPTKAWLDVGADRLGSLAGSVLVMLALLVPARATLLLLLGASALAMLTLVLTRRVQEGYVAALADSLRAGTVDLDPGEAVDPTTRAMMARTPSGVPPAAGQPVGEAGAALVQEPAPWLEAAAALRSGDRDRIRRTLREHELTPELVAPVIALLARDDLFTDTVTALRRVGGRYTGQLVDVLLDPQQDPVVRRRVPRVLKGVPSQRAAEGLLAALGDARFDVRYRSAQTLIRLRQGQPPVVIPPAEAFAAALRELSGGPSSPHGLDHVFRLLSLGLPGEPVTMALRAWRTGESALRGTALEYLQNVLPPTLAAALWPWLGAPPSGTGRTLEEIRDDLLRSTAAAPESGRR